MDARGFGCGEGADIELGDEGKLSLGPDSFSPLVDSDVDAAIGSVSMACSLELVTSSRALTADCDAVSVASCDDDSSVAPEVDPVVESEPVEDIESLDEFDPGDFNWLLSVFGGEEAEEASFATSFS